MIKHIVLSGSLGTPFVLNKNAPTLQSLVGMVYRGLNFSFVYADDRGGGGREDRVIYLFSDFKSMVFIDSVQIFKNKCGPF